MTPATNFADGDRPAQYTTGWNRGSRRPREEVSLDEMSRCFVPSHTTKHEGELLPPPSGGATCGRSKASGWPVLVRLGGRRAGERQGCARSRFPGTSGWSAAGGPVSPGKSVPFCSILSRSGMAVGGEARLGWKQVWVLYNLLQGVYSSIDGPGADPSAGSTIRHDTSELSAPTRRGMSPLRPPCMFI